MINEKEPEIPKEKIVLGAIPVPIKGLRSVSMSKRPPIQPFAPNKKMINPYKAYAIRKHPSTISSKTEGESISKSRKSLDGMLGDENKIASHADELIAMIKGIQRNAAKVNTNNE